MSLSRPSLPNHRVWLLGNGRPLSVALYGFLLRPPQSGHEPLVTAPPRSDTLLGSCCAAAPRRRRSRCDGIRECAMFALFERLLKPTAIPDRAEPPPGFIAFFWHFASQAKGLFAALFAAGFVVALLDSTIPLFMGRIVNLITASRPEHLFSDFWPVLAAMALVVLLGRPLAIFAQNLLANQAIAANVSNRIRWQNHWYVVRQSWAFFQNDFAGRIANRVMQTGPAIRETLVALLTAVWYILVYGTSALLLLASADPWLALPVALWFAGYLVLLRVFVPRMRDRSKDMSEARSMLTGRTAFRSSTP